MGNGESCPSGQHWDDNAGTTIVGGQGDGGGSMGACVDNPAPAAEKPDTQPIAASAAGTVFDSSAQNAQRPAWNQLSPLHL
jgi:hypothetical protein